MSDEQPDSKDPLYDEALALVEAMDFASISMMQRRLGIGYVRASEMIDFMVKAGDIEPVPGSVKYAIAGTLPRQAGV